MVSLQHKRNDFGNVAVILDDDIVVDKDILKVCLQYGPPMYYLDDDTACGFDYELVKLVANIGDMKLKLIPVVTAEEGIRLLENRKVELLIARIPVTADVRSSFLFTQPVFSDSQVLLQRDTNGAIRSQLQLGGDTVWLPANSSLRKRVEALSEEIGEPIYVEQDPEYGAEQLFHMVRNGDIRFAVISKGVADEMSKKYSGVNTRVAVSMTQLYAWTLRKDEANLCAKIDSLLSIAKTDSIYLEILKRYSPRSLYIQSTSHDVNR